MNLFWLFIFVGVGILLYFYLRQKSNIPTDINKISIKWVSIVKFYFIYNSVYIMKYVGLFIISISFLLIFLDIISFLLENINIYMHCDPSDGSSESSQGIKRKRENSEEEQAGATYEPKKINLKEEKEPAVYISHDSDYSEDEDTVYAVWINDSKETQTNEKSK